MSEPRRAVLLLSGGLDSATVLAIARAQGFEVYALAFSYGQRHDVELRAAERVAKAGGAAELRVVELDLRAFGGSALTSELEVPKGRDAAEIEAAVDEEVPVTYVPARNTIFLSFGLAFAEVLSARDIFLGANRVDFSGYPDCRPEFVQAFEELANVATAHAKGGRIRVHAPLMDMNKADIIREGTRLGVDYAITHSCYDPVLRDDEVLACGRCDACVLRRKGFTQAGVKDPTRYA
jgi:7-cyano-7-deazaguanine synthase